MKLKKLTGRVVDYQFGNYRIDCDDAPKEYLKIHFLSQTLINPHRVKIGDKVELEYRTGPSSGLWFVSGVKNG